MENKEQYHESPENEKYGGALAALPFNSGLFCFVFIHCAK
jgi:hypothetical protein